LRSDQLINNVGDDDDVKLYDEEETCMIKYLHTVYTRWMSVSVTIGQC